MNIKFENWAAVILLEMNEIVIREKSFKVQNLYFWNTHCIFSIRLVIFIYKKLPAEQNGKFSSHFVGLLRGQKWHAKNFWFIT